MAKRRKLSILAGALLALGATTAVWAYFTAIGSGTGSASISTLASPSPVTASNPAPGTVLVEWSMVVPPSGDQGDVSYVVERSADDGATFSPASGACAGSVPGSATSCDDTLTIAGDYSYRVTARFATWTSTGTSDAVNVVVDATPPTTSITITPTSPDGSAGWYKTIPSFALSASDAGGTGVASTHYKIDAGAAQTYSAAVAIPVGQHTISYWSVDNAGNVEATQTTAAIKVDATAPVTTIAVSPSSPNGSGGWYKTNAPTFTLAASDALGGNSGLNGNFYQIDGGAQQAYSGAVTIPEGQHTITYWSQDVAGNVEVTQTTATIKVDATTPVTTVAVSPSSPNGSGGWYKTTAPTFTLTASDAVGGNSGLSGTFYQIDAAAQQTYSGAVTIPEGQHTITYWSQDVAGNVEATQTTATIKVDTTAPTLSLKTTAPTTTATYGAGLSGTTVFYQDCPAGSFGFRFIGTVTDGESGAASVTYPGLTAGQWDSHASSETISSPAGGPYTSTNFLWSPNNCSGGAAASPGSYNVTATDAAGNTTSAALTFTADRIAPTVTNVTLNNGGSPNVIDQNDFVEVTYSEVLDASSVCSTWVNGASQSLTSGVTVSVSTVDVMTVSSTGCTFRFGSVTLNANYNSSASSAMTFGTGSSLTWDPATKKLKILLGSRSGGTVGTVAANSTPSYANANAARESDFGQIPIATSSFNGSSSRF